VAQLIKMKDCISRYELNMFHYTSQFSTLKQRRWDEWENLWKESTFYAKDEMKRKFRQMLFQSQLNWATSTLKQESDKPEKLIASEKLKFFLEEFPDNYLLMIEPVFKLDKAFTEAEILLFSPNKIYCVSYIENSKNSIISVQKSNFWIQTRGNQQQKILSPYLSINRMAEVIKSIFGSAVYEYPVEYVVIAPHGYIEYENQTNKVTIIDQRNVDSWVNKMIGLRDPIKYKQLKAAETMLKSCESKYFERIELEL
jgi:hypothetical protein